MINLNFWFSCSLRYLIFFSVFFRVDSAIAESWDFRDNSTNLGYGYEKRTDNDIFVGQKVILDAKTSLISEKGEVSEKLKCCARPSDPEYFYGLLDAKFRWGTDGTDLEYTRIGVTPWATLWKPAGKSTDDLRTKWDLFELGATRFVVDDALEVDSYLELSFLRAGRMGEYNWSEDSLFTVTAGLQASTGWAWGKSNDEAYSEVSNPFAGLFINIGIEHVNWGKLYTRQRFVNGFSFSSPARGHPTAREARVRLGYFKQMINCFALDVYIEKRSFYFDEGDLPALYTQSGTVAAEVVCNW